MALADLVRTWRTHGRKHGRKMFPGGVRRTGRISGHSTAGYVVSECYDVIVSSRSTGARPLIPWSTPRRMEDIGS